MRCSNTRRPPPPATFPTTPIPPLDGSHILYQLLPAELGARYRQFGRYGAVVLLLVVFLAPEVLYTLLRPAFFLQAAACGIVQPWALSTIPVCGP